MVTVEEANSQSQSQSQSVESSDSMSQNIENKSQSRPSPKPHHHHDEKVEEESDSDSDPESESDSDSNSESKSESDVRTPARKPMNEQQKPTVVKKPNAVATATPSKRHAEGEGKATEPKRLKKKQEHEVEAETSEKKPVILAMEATEDSKKLLFQRLWSDADELMILQGMIDYAATKKTDSVADWNAFYDFIKNDLHVEVMKSQLQDKIRRMKKKYLNRKKREEMGKSQMFLNFHDKKCYLLSRKIWGKEVGNVTEVKEMINSGKKIMSGDIEREKIVDVERERRKLKLKEMKLNLKTLDLMRTQAKFELDVLKSKLLDD